MREREKREKDVELPRYARQLTIFEYDVMLVCKEIYDSKLVQVPVMCFNSARSLCKYYHAFHKNFTHVQLC